MSRSTRYYYAVHDRDGFNAQSAIFETWADTQEHVKAIHNGSPHVTRPLYKKFASLLDAQYFAMNGRQRPLPADEAGTLTVYTDGCAKPRGQTMIGGIGVYFCREHPWNLCEPLLDGERPTNNRAELTALKRALELLHEKWRTDATIATTLRRVVVRTDSAYACRAVGEWRAKWQATNFRNNTLKNRELVEAVWALIDSAPFIVDVVWTEGHSGGTGNDIADALANAGAERTPPLG